MKADQGPDAGSPPPVQLDALPEAASERPPVCESDGGEACVRAVCGDGIWNATAGEQCDDGDRAAGDGCTPDCTLETDFFCPTPGVKCVSTVVCGDGRVSGSEQCDDRNAVAGDGCSDTCRLEPGWICPAAAMRCLPVCGDGVIEGREQCDDGNMLTDDGCTDTCRIQPGFACPTAGDLCHRTVCGDGRTEGGESCDDRNLLGGDGCSPSCQSEPICTGTAGCTSPCGDGLKLPGEDCDDGNNAPGDGCSATCQLEPRWDCAAVGDVGATLAVPVVYRDFIRHDAPGGHPNFEFASADLVIPGMVDAALGPDRKPRLVMSPPPTAQVTTPAVFATWYTDSAYGKTIGDVLLLEQQPDGTFVYDRPSFFPLDNRGWAEPPAGPEIPFLGTSDLDGLRHNFGFTSEVRYWFEYKGGEALTFVGDDDVWVFINGQLAVDLGGIHSAATGGVVLDPAGAARFGPLVAGRIYDIAVFQAERHVTRSSYKLTLANFSLTRTVCTPRCGDGIINGDELCDDGDNDGRYGGCMPGCAELGPYCGDGQVASGIEACDNGTNLSVYGEQGCAPGCRLVPFCGDNKIDGAFGEQCDDGNTIAGDGCSVACQKEVN